jgi:hypothetical protein
MPGRRTALPGKLESQVQREILNFLRDLHIFHWVVKNTGTFDPRKGNFRKVPKSFRHGVPDIHGFHKRFFVIEVKREVGGVLSKEQKDFKADFEQIVAPHGGLYILATNVETVAHAFHEVGLLDC